MIRGISGLGDGARLGPAAAIVMRDLPAHLRPRAVELLPHEMDVAARGQEVGPRRLALGRRQSARFAEGGFLVVGSGIEQALACRAAGEPRGVIGAVGRAGEAWPMMGAGFDVRV